MRNPKKLYKTTVVIWSEDDTSGLELEEVFEETMWGMAYCSSQQSNLIDDPENDPDWDGTEFFKNLYGDNKDA